MSQDFTDDWYGQAKNADTAFQNAEKNDLALKSNFSGSSAPLNPVAGMWWLDTTNHILKQRNEANTAWISMFNLTTGQPCNLPSASATAPGVVQLGTDPDVEAGISALLVASLKQLNDYYLKKEDFVINQSTLGAYTAGNDLLIASSDNQAETTSIDFVKKKEIYIPRGGSLRIQFDIKADTTYQYAYAQVFHNEEIIGTLQSAYHTSYPDWVTKTEDISGFSAGDFVQLYIKSGHPAVTAYIRNFRLYATDSYQTHVIL